ncbi:MAG TPA: Smr/MutS family protein [Bacillota bacterium]|nr:Smr/MutS family protein [Bacillota bacterium]HPE38130.1 Smr/MutS family protein [Bacillota bacterium]
MAASIINLEEGRPSVDEAMRRLRLQVNTMRRLGIRQIKVIHGYGSSGKGGVIKTATHEVLRVMADDGKIRLYCPGEQFGPFEKNGRTVVELCPAFRNDPDWARSNDGITVLLLK